MPTKKIRVLFLDDTIEVIDSLKHYVQEISTGDGYKQQFEFNYIRMLHEELIEASSGNKYKAISFKVFDELAKVCDSPFDYIISDFAFIADADKNNELRTILEAHKRAPTRAELKQYCIFTHEDFKNRFQEYLSPATQSNGSQEKIGQHFFGHIGGLLVYTNAPWPFRDYFSVSELDKRKTELRSTFSRLTKQKEPKIMIINDLFAIPEVLYKIKNEQILGTTIGEEAVKKMTSSITAKGISSFLMEEALFTVVQQQKNLRFKSASSAYRELVVFGIGIGAIGGLFGDVLYKISKSLPTEWGKHFPIETPLNSLSVLFSLQTLNFLFVLCSYFLFFVVAIPSVIGWVGVKYAKRIESKLETVVDKA